MKTFFTDIKFILTAGKRFTRETLTNEKDVTIIQLSNTGTDNISESKKPVEGGDISLPLANIISFYFC